MEGTNARSTIGISGFVTSLTLGTRTFLTGALFDLTECISAGFEVASIAPLALFLLMDAAVSARGCNTVGTLAHVNWTWNFFIVLWWRLISSVTCRAGLTVVLNTGITLGWCSVLACAGVFFA